MCLSNFKAIRRFKAPISWLRDFTRSYGKTSFRILRRGPGNGSACVLWSYRLISDTSCLITAWISNHMHSKLCDEIACPFPSFNGWTVEVFEWISNFTPNFIVDVITYTCWDFYVYCWNHHFVVIDRCMISYCKLLDNNGIIWLKTILKWKLLAILKPAINQDNKKSGISIFDIGNTRIQIWVVRRRCHYFASA